MINFVLLRRDSVTVGTDDDGPGLRLAVVGLVHGGAGRGGGRRLHALDRAGPRPAQRHRRGGAASPRVAEATATFSPAGPDRLDRPGRGDDGARSRPPRSRSNSRKSTVDLAQQEHLRARRSTMSAGRRGARAGGGQRGGGHAGHPERAGSAAQPGGAGAAGDTGQAGRAAGWSRRRADQRPIRSRSAQPGVVHLEAAVHHHGACRPTRRHAPPVRRTDPACSHSVFGRCAAPVHRRAPPPARSGAGRRRPGRAPPAGRPGSDTSAHRRSR